LLQQLAFTPQDARDVGQAHAPSLRAVTRFRPVFESSVQDRA
jgi:hypothetical protein